MKQSQSMIVVQEMMTEFAELTGLSSTAHPPRRYLWTDSFAVCNLLWLYRMTADKRYRDLALKLVDQVHHILGRHREDDKRRGWISGLSETDGELHPTAGGLRIGKEMNERRPSDRFDERVEWDRDGQYYHYLTKWMHALNRVSRVTGEHVYNTWAIELAKAVHRRFTYMPQYGSQKRMFWKMSIDLSRPLVESMGHHDPLDGFITYSQLQASLQEYQGRSKDADLAAEIADMAAICKGKDWVTDDPLGLGELLSSAYKIARLNSDGVVIDSGLMDLLLDSAAPGLNSYVKEGAVKLPAEYRLAFRELGLSIGLHAVERLRELRKDDRRASGRGEIQYNRIKPLERFLPLGETIENFWLDPGNRESAAWTEHRDINIVMLATSLGPDGYLG
ncbi:MAG TPA: hypothetical protein VK435_08015 [Thermodesulfovibrionales bacterium]|nr:hypothetical protein [Thermodesulfovibrionales bacterium]